MPVVLIATGIDKRKINCCISQSPKVEIIDMRRKICKITSFGLFCILCDYNLVIELMLYRASRSVNSSFASYQIQRHSTHILLASDITIIPSFALAVDFANGVNKFNRYVGLPHFVLRT